MFTTKTRLEKSAIHGIGVFADEFVAKGTIIRKYQDNFDITLSDKQFEQLPKIAQEYVLFYWYYNKNEGGHILCGDNARFTNHSKEPNMAVLNLTDSIAIKDIQVGDEITEDYFNFDEKSNLKFVPN